MNPNSVYNYFYKITALIVVVIILTSCVSSPVPDLKRNLRVANLGDLVVTSPMERESTLIDVIALSAAFKRVHDIGYRLSAGNLPLCGHHRLAQSGVIALNSAALTYVGLGPSARWLGIDERLSILHVVSGSPAANAGLIAGDIVELVNSTPVPLGSGGLDMLLRVVRNTSNPVSLTIRRGTASDTILIKPEDACDFHPTFMSDPLLIWDGGQIDLERANDSMVAFAIAHTEALRMIGPRRGIALSWGDLGEGIDFSLSMVPFAVGVGTLGGWSAKPVDIFQGPTRDETAKKAKRRLHDDADIEADALALKMVHMAGYPIEEVIAAWTITVRGHDQEILHKRLELLRIEKDKIMGDRP